jgi:hypothetical protein
LPTTLITAAGNAGFVEQAGLIPAKALALVRQII